MEQPLFSGDPRAGEKPHTQARVNKSAGKKRLVRDQEAAWTSGAKSKLGAQALSPLSGCVTLGESVNSPAIQPSPVNGDGMFTPRGCYGD